MLSSWFTFLWPLIKEILASLKDSPEQQGRDQSGGSTKAVTAILFVAILAIGDMAVDANSELEKLKNETKVAKPATKEVELITQDRVELLLCQTKESNLMKELTALKDVNKSLSDNLAKKCEKSIDRLTSDRLKRLNKDD
jgi:hypothetical protein